MPNPLRIAARILTGSTYAILGFDAVRAPGGRVDTAAPTLALGILPRASAVALLASLVPTTIAGHGFWAIEDPAARKLQRTQFHKNMAMLGGLLFVALDPPRPRDRRGASR